jgi:hypothetical protein
VNTHQTRVEHEHRGQKHRIDRIVAMDSIGAVVDPTQEAIKIVGVDAPKRREPQQRSHGHFKSAPNRLSCRDGVGAARGATFAGLGDAAAAGFDCGRFPNITRFPLVCDPRNTT